MLLPSTVRLATLLLALAAAQAPAQPVSVLVNTQSTLGPFQPVWAFFGYAEPNYTYMRDGRKLVEELAALGPMPVYISTHNLLNSGDGTPAPQWGSTNVYTKAPAGYPIYNWTIGDRIFDTWHNAKLRPLVEIGCMPEALSTHPAPYRQAGWAYPPKDYRAWGELVYRWVRHEVERYGPDDVKPWLWEVWNEPDGVNWKGTPEEYYKLYDFAADAVKRAFPDARIGGPHSSDPAGAKAAAFLRGFLEHCIRGTNYATGKTGAPLDYIGFHRRSQAGVARGFEMVASFPELRDKPVILGDSVADENATRHESPAHRAAELEEILELARARGIQLAGVITEAFEYEDRPWFARGHALATHGVDLPLLNLFRMFGKMAGERLKADSSRRPDIGVLATGGGRKTFVLLWNDAGGDAALPDAGVELTLAGLPAAPSRIEVHHYRIDGAHSDAYAAWSKMGAPPHPTPEQVTQLENAGKLELLEYPQRIPKTGTEATLKFTLPRHAVSLVEVSW